MRARGVGLASKYWLVMAPARGEATREPTCWPAFSGERRRCTSRTSSQTNRNAGIVRDVIDGVICVHAMPGCTRLTVTGSTSRRLPATVRVGLQKPRRALTSTALAPDRRGRALTGVGVHDR